ncbi:MAG: DUF192 domain-containing protein [Acidobacteria bacterium]|nr:DUF192 domain-containing protein [Acidobacteriota bacterium]
MANRTRGTVVGEEVEAAFDSAARKRGLLGREGLPAGVAMVIAPCGAVHTWFMRFSIDVVFAARDGRVLKVRPNVAPWRLAVGLRAFAAIEGAVGMIERSGTQTGDVLAVLPREDFVEGPCG